MKVPIKIKRKVRDGDYLISGHCQDELEADGFEGTDAVYAILTGEVWINLQVMSRTNGIEFTDRHAMDAS